MKVVAPESDNPSLSLPGILKAAKMGAKKNGSFGGVVVRLIGVLSRFPSWNRCLLSDLLMTWFTDLFFKEKSRLNSYVFFMF